MKRCISILITVALMLAMLPGAAAFSDTEGTAIDKQAQFLQALGFIEGNTDGTLGVDEEVTRADFVKIINKVMNMTDIKFTENGFSDVPASHPAYADICNAVGNGLVKGYPDGQFRPDEAIILPEAMEILVSLLGYTVQAERAGGYPAGYMSVASSLRLIGAGTELSGEALHKGEVVSIIYNALDVDMMKLTIGTNAGYEVTDTNILEERHDIYRSRGRITMNEYTGLYSVSTVNKNEIKIDSRDYGEQVYMLGNADVNVFDALGLEMDYYFRDNEAEGTCELVYMTPYKEAEYIVVQDEDIVGYEGGVFSYYQDDRLRTTKIADGAAIIYNYQAVTSSAEFDAAMFKPENGQVTLVKTNGNCNIVKIESFVDYVTNGVNKDTMTVYDKLTPNKFICFDTDRTDLEYAIIEDLSGSEVSVEDIEAMDILSVAQSRSGNFVRAIVSGSGIRGKITNISEDYIFIENEKHQLSVEFKKYLQDNGISLTLGSMGVFYLDFRAKIAAMDTESNSELRFAYVVKVVEDEDETYLVKLFDQDNTMKKIRANKSVSINGEGFKDTYLPVAGLEGRIIMYKLNAEGMLRQIQTGIPNATGNSGELLVIYDDPNTQQRYKDNVLSFGGMFHITQDTKVFTVPSLENLAGADDEKDFKVTNNQYFRGDASYTVTAYSTIKNSLIADVVICNTLPGSESIHSDAVVYIVEDMTVEVNEEDEIVEKLVLNNNGTPASYEIDRERVQQSFDLNTLAKGDLVKISQQNDVIVRIERFFDIVNRQATAGDADYNGINHIVFGPVQRKDRHVISVKNEFSGKVENQVTNRGTILQCEVSPNGKLNITGASAADIITADTAGKDASYVFMQCRYAEPKILIIYKFND